MRTAFACIALLGAWSVLDGAEPVPPETALGNEAVTLRDWWVLGPYRCADEDGVALDEDFLGPGGARESALDAPKLAELASGLPGGSAVADLNRPHFEDVRNSEFVDFQYLYGRPDEQKGPEEAVYAACRLLSPAERPAFLLLGSADGAKVWLNGRLIWTAPGPRMMAAYNDSIPVRLASGSNLLVLKVARARGAGWVMGARVEFSAVAATATILSRQGVLDARLLKTALVGPSHPLELQIDGAPKGVPFEVRITREDGGEVARASLGAPGATWAPGPELAPGIYRATLESGGAAYSQPFCIGAPAGILSALRRRAVPFTKEDRVALNFGALEERMDALLAAGPPKRSLLRNNVLEDPREWERKIAYTLGEYTAEVEALEAGREAFSGVPGLHLRGFRSRIDGQAEYFQLYVPRSYDPAGPGVPLAILIAAPVAGARPFVRSPMMAAHSEAEYLSAFAERLGMAILWPGYRNRPYGLPCEFTHFDEVMAAFAKDYKVDPDRVTLFGDCGSGIMASMIAVRWPERFAAIGLLHPVFHRRRNSFDDDGGFVKFPAFKEWLAADDPFKPLLAVRNLPIYIICDGEKPGHGDLENSYEFQKEGAGVHFPLRFERRPQTIAEHIGTYGVLLDWLSKQRREHASAVRNEAFFTSGAGAGPVARAFADRFIVVEGTGGSPADRAAMRALGASFSESWAATQFGACRVVRDTELSDEDERTSNLVLLGSAATNSVWRRASAELPVDLEEDRVGIGGRTWSGTDLGVQAIFKSPFDSGHSVVLIGGADLAGARFGTLNLSVDGWFDYAVWANDHGRPRLLAADHF